MNYTCKFSLHSLSHIITVNQKVICYINCIIYIYNMVLFIVCLYTDLNDNKMLLFFIYINIYIHIWYFFVIQNRNQANTCFFAHLTAC